MMDGHSQRAKFTPSPLYEIYSSLGGLREYCLFSSDAVKSLLKIWPTCFRILAARGSSRRWSSSLWRLWTRQPVFTGRPGVRGRQQRLPQRRGRPGHAQKTAVSVQQPAGGPARGLLPGLRVHRRWEEEGAQQPDEPSRAADQGLVPESAAEEEARVWAGLCQRLSVEADRRRRKFNELSHELIGVLLKVPF